MPTIKHIKRAVAAASLISCSAAAIASAPSSALACNPSGCGGLSKEELARDKAEIRRLNREQLRYVRQRDARYAKGWQEARAYPDRVKAHEKRMVEHERRMREWREAVRRCEAGDYRYCAQ